MTNTNNQYVEGTSELFFDCVKNQKNQELRISKPGKAVNPVWDMLGLREI